MRKYGLLLGDSTFKQYYLKFLEHGIAGLKSSRKNNTYIQAFKESVVKEYLQTDLSIKGLARKYNIPSPFWGIIKVEMYRLRSYETFEKLEEDISHYIEFYNTERVTLNMGLRISA